MTSARCFALVLALLGLSTVASAHHSYAAFDATRRLTARGTVKALEWTNPHVWVWVDVTADGGRVEVYGFETNAPSELTRFFGWTKRSLTPGDTVTIDYIPLRSGRPGGALVRLTMSDGRVLRTPRSSSAPASSAELGVPQPTKDAK